MDLKNIFDFLYGVSPLNINEGNVGRLIKIADMLLIEKVVELCGSYMEKEIRPENAVTFYKYYRLYGNSYKDLEVFEEFPVEMSSHFSDVFDKHYEDLAANLHVFSAYTFSLGSRFTLDFADRNANFDYKKLLKLACNWYEIYAMRNPHRIQKEFEHYFFNDNDVGFDFDKFTLPMWLISPNEFKEFTKTMLAQNVALRKLFSLVPTNNYV